MSDHLQDFKIRALTKKVERLQKANRLMSKELIEIKNVKSHQDSFIDAIENVIADHGFKLVEIS